jgi:hypothetical protein
MYVGGTRMYTWRKVMSGRQCFERIMASMNHWWCFLGSPTPLLHSKQWWTTSSKIWSWSMSFASTSTTFSSTWRTSADNVNCSWMPTPAQAIPLQWQVRIWEDHNQISQPCHFRGWDSHGSDQGCRCIAHSDNKEGSIILPGICKFLPVLHWGLLPPCQTTFWTDEKGSKVGMGWWSTAGLRWNQAVHNLLPNSLICQWCKSVSCGSQL